VTPFRRLWLAQTISLLGDFLAVFAVQIAVTFRMHGSARQVSGVFIAGLLPGILFGPLAGAWADRWDPRRTMVTSDAVRAGLVLLLPWAQQLPQIYAISFAMGCVACVFGPALSITIPLLVPREELGTSIARLQQSMQVMRIASPTLAAALAASFGERVCYYADSASFLFSACTVASLRYSRMKCPANAPSRMGEGFRFLAADARFRFVMLALTLGIFAGSCFGALAAVYVRDTLQRGPAVLGLISSLIGAATVVGSVLMGRLMRGRDPKALVAMGITGVGASILTFAVLSSEAGAYLASIAMGFGVATVMPAATVLLQGQAPAELRGRISGATAALTSLAQLSGMLFAGWWAAWIGVRGVFGASAGLLLLTGVIAGRDSRRPLASAHAGDSRPVPGGN